MKTSQRIWKVVMTLLLALPILLGAFLATPVSAVEVPSGPPENENQLNIIVHKLHYKDNLPNPLIQNTGEEMTGFTGTALPGAGFTVYDISDYYYANTTNMSPAAARDHIKNNEAAAIAAGTVAAVEAETDALGNVVFLNLNMKAASGKDAAYLIVETKMPNSPTITEKAASMLLVMPIIAVNKDEDGNDVLNRNVHVYPKNVSAENKKEMLNIPPKVTINDQVYPSVNIGDEIDYKITVNVPANYDALDKYVIKDTPANGLALVGTVDTGVAIAGPNGALVKDIHYTIAPDGNGFRIELIKAATGDLAGKMLTITYKMKLTAAALPDTPYPNHASVILIKGETETEQGITPPPGLVTGGMVFVKHDAHTGALLGGAEFVVMNAAGKYAKFNNDKNTQGDYVFNSWVDNLVDATRLVSANTTGKFSINGLFGGTADGTSGVEYKLKEVTAPVGYVLNNAEIPFIIKGGSYSTTNTAGGERLPNVPKGLLPATGGMGIYVFLAVGSLLMGGAYLWFKKSKQHIEI